MNHFVDIHNHMAWGVDDGMESRDNAIIALSNAHKDGITEIIATPHFVPGQYDQKKIDEINERIHELKELAETYHIEIYTGAELFLNSGYLDMIDEGKCPSLAESKYILCEFDVRKELPIHNYDVEDKLYEISIRGYIPIIAHVERYFHKKIDLSRIQKWIDMGCVIQINRTSLLGMHGSVCKDNSQRLLENNLVHLVATDTHRCVGERICQMSDVYGYIKDHYGLESAEILCKRNPMHIINNQNLEWIETKKQSVWKRMFGRS